MAGVAGARRRCRARRAASSSGGQGIVSCGAQVAAPGPLARRRPRCCDSCLQTCGASGGQSSLTLQLSATRHPLL